MDDAQHWLQDVRDWITEQIGGPVEVAMFRERTWGRTVRVETKNDVLFFKEPSAPGRFESIVVSDIAQRWPGLVPDIVATDHDRGWLLMRDHGVPVREAAASDPVGVLEAILPLYSVIQRESRDLVERWISAGIPDRRLELLPGLVDDIASGKTWLGPLDVPYDLVEPAIADLTLVVGELSRSPFAIGIDHSDMHEGNILVADGSARLIDWGDASITHPFATLFVAFQHVVSGSRAGERLGVAHRLRDAYLDAWAADASRDELRDAFAKATWLGYVIRALNFVHQLEDHDDLIDSHTSVAQFLTRWATKRDLLTDPDALVAAIAAEKE